MKKKIQIIICGSLAYWFLVFLLRKLLGQVGISCGIFFNAIVVPFILGVIISILIKDKKSWIYGAVSYLIYFMWVFLFGWMIDLHFTGFVEHFFAMIKVFFYLGSIATLFAAFGGFLGDYIRKRRLS